MNASPNQFDQVEDGQEIVVGQRRFKIIGALRNFKIEDSFIHRQNKLLEHTGNGESKKHVGTYSRAEEISTFFEYDAWGTPHKDPSKSNRKTIVSAKHSGAFISGNCFFSKANFKKYLAEAEEEFLTQGRAYRRDIGEKYAELCAEVERLSDGPIWFEVYDASDSWNQRQNRGYIRSDGTEWDLFRRILLPKRCYLTILKLGSLDGHKEIPSFYFRVHWNYFNLEREKVVLKTIENEHVDAEVRAVEEKKSRQGQPKFKEDVLLQCPQCLFTKITDDRLLDAAHIKPYSQFEEDKILRDVTMDEDDDTHYAQNPNNGLSLTPTFHRLFDRGFFTFDKEGRLICSPQLSTRTWSQLNVNPKARPRLIRDMLGREEFMSYHREHVFRDEFETFA